MKKVRNIIFALLGGLLVAILGFVIWLNSTPRPEFSDVDVPHLQVARDSATLARGRDLVIMNCVDCHRNPETGTLSGKFFGENPLGKAHTANITRDPVYGTGKYTEGEMYRMLRTGVKQNHQLALPFMPRYALMAEEDMHAIIAFMTSDDPLLAPSQDERPIETSFLGDALTKLAWKPLPYQQTEETAPSRTDPVAYGKYLVTARLLCFACHSASHEVNLGEPERTEGYLAGGAEFGPGVIAPSIQRSAAGIGDWSEAEFVQALRSGIGRQGDSLRSPMQAYPELEVDEVSAIWAYLGSF